MNQVLSPWRVTKSILLVAMLTVPSYLVVSPDAGAQPVPCVAHIAGIFVTPTIWVDRNQTVTIRAHVVNNATLPGQDPPAGDLAPRLRVRITATYPGGTSGDAVLSTSGHLIPPTNHTARFTVSPDAANGLGTILVELLPATGAPVQCVIPESERVREWGFVVGDKPDLTITGMTLIRHWESDVPAQDSHGDMQDGERITRYRDVRDGTVSCNEQIITPGAQVLSNAHFRLDVYNNGTAAFEAPDGSRSPLPVRVRVLDKGVPVSTLPTTILVSVSPDSTARPITTALNYNLVNKSGLRNLTFVIDAFNEIPEGPDGETNNEFSSAETNEPPNSSYTFIKAPDMETNFTDVNLNLADRKVTGTVLVRNIGSAGAGSVDPGQICQSRNGRSLNFSLYLDRIAPETRVPLEDVAAQNYEPEQEAEFTFEVDDVGSGTRRLLAVPYEGNQINDLNTSNDVDEFVVVIEDVLTPTFIGQVNATAGPNGFRVGQRINISGNLSDDADFRSEDNVIQIEAVFHDGTLHNFTVLRGDPNSNVLRHPVDTDRYMFWLNSAYPQAGTYQFRVRATDSANHSALAPPEAADPRTFTLTDYARALDAATPLAFVQICQELTANVTSNCVEFTGNATRNINYTFAPNLTVEVIFKVAAGGTGLNNESRNFTRKTVMVTDPDGVVLGNFTVSPKCWNNATSQTVPCVSPTPIPEDCEDAPLGVCYNYMFGISNPLRPPASPTWRVGGSSYQNRSLFLNPANCGPFNQTVNARFLEPGRFNYTFYIGDAACTYTGHGHPNVPLFQIDLWDNVTAQIRDVTPATGTSVDAGSSASFRAHLSDNYRVKQGFVLVKRNGVQVGLHNMSALDFSDRNTSSGNYSVSIPTGLGTSLCEAGSYTWQVGARDSSTQRYESTPQARARPDSLSYSAERTLTVRDTRDPAVTNDRSSFPDGTPSDAFQVGDQLILQGEVDDDTCFTARAIVRNANGLQVLALNLTREGAAGPFVSANITTGAGAMLPEGEYNFVIEVTDSANRITRSLARNFRVASNLPPSFIGRTPEDNGFGRPDAQAAVDVNDLLHGVLRSSVVVRIGVGTNPGANITLPAGSVHVTDREVRADGVALGLHVAIDLPAFAQHGDDVVIEVQATDGTNLTGNATWRFKLDGLVPRSSLSCTPSSPPNCGGTVPAVRGDTLFTISALDEDPDNKARSGIAQLRYVVNVAGVASPPQVATANTTSFALNQFATQDGVVQIRYRAIDRAGNEEPERPFSVHLDTNGPLIQNVLTTPTSTGWNITATITDLASDVESVALHHRTGITDFQTLTMTRLQDTQFWTATLPAARRGTNVCYYIEARDVLGNVASNGTEAAPVCFGAENHPPQVRILSPLEGESVGATMTIRWEVSDVDGDRPTVSIAYRQSTAVQLIGVQLTPEEARGSGSKIVDTSALPQGTYVLRVEATDGQPFNNRTSVSVNFVVGEGGVVRPILDRTSINPGERVKVTMTLPKPANEVEAVAIRDNREVVRAAMDQNPPGSNTWEGFLTLPEPGVYTIEVQGTYTDGTEFRIAAAQQLRVGGGFGIGIDGILIAILAAAVVALAATGLRRRWP